MTTRMAMTDERHQPAIDAIEPGGDLVDPAGHLGQQEEHEAEAHGRQHQHHRDGLLGILDPPGAQRDGRRRRPPAMTATRKPDDEVRDDDDGVVEARRAVPAGGVGGDQAHHSTATMARQPTSTGTTSLPNRMASSGSRRGQQGRERLALPLPGEGRGHRDGHDQRRQQHGDEDGDDAVGHPVGPGLDRQPDGPEGEHRDHDRSAGAGSGRG